MKTEVSLRRFLRWPSQLLLGGSLVAGSVAAVVGGVLPALVAGMAMAGGAFVHQLSRRRRRVHASVEGDTLVLGDTRIPITSLREGWLEPRSSRPSMKRSSRHEHDVLVLRDRRGNEWRASFRSLEAATTFLEALRLDPQQRSVHMRRQESSSIGASCAIIVPSLFGVGAVAMLALSTNWRWSAHYIGAVPLLCLGVLAAGWAAHRFLRFHPLVIGADGIRWKDDRGSHFVAHTDITSVHTRRRLRILVVETQEDTWQIDFGQVSEAHLRATLHRLNETLGERAAALAQLDREGLSLHAWKDKLRRLFGEDGAYRGVHVPRVRVEAALEDPHTSPERRVGAALALMGSIGLDEGRKIRARIAELAETVADEDLAEAFEQIAQGELRPTTADKLRS